ncbi:MAG: alpha/beta hydrolase [Phenylobacterium sp.]|uniref:alpha/beta fold hydrolase n=1 Tax=Phenylobacterium sp. TaxID=1871053 RepID=UPI001A4B199F|nr:alpha/beta hydrolase [Phenylobacterium sp.]MBL8771003.1 alpha/beta hydrolase [Phenylobacterium sp.]
MFVSVNGVRLFVEVLGPKLAPDGPRMVERPTVVALHGGPTDHAHMLPMVAALADVAQVVVYDHRGCGRSEPGDPARWTMDQWADDVRGVCEALGIEKPIVFGHSFGGYVTQAYAIRHPGHAARLVMAGTGPRFDAALSAEGFRRQGGDAAAEAFAAFAANPGPDTTAAFVANCRRLYTTSRKMDADVEARTVTNVPLLFDFFGRETRALDFTQGLGRVTAPVLILGGDEDPVMPPAYQDALEAALVNAPVRRLSFPNCGHALALDAPDALASALRDWATGG